MQQSITSKFSIAIAAFLLAFGAAFTAYAYDNLEIEIDISSTPTEVDVEYDDENGDPVLDEYDYGTSDLGEIYTLLAAVLGTSTDVVEAAVTNVVDEEEVNEDEEEAIEAVADATEAIEVAETYIEDLDLAEDSDELAELEADLAAAKDLLAQAEVALEAGDFEEAEELAEDAEDDAEEIYEEEEEDEEEGDEEEAADAIKDAIEEIEKAEVVIADAEEDGKETELSSTTLAEAKEVLVEAEVAFEAGDFEEAEELADKAEDLAQLARMKYIDKTADDISDDEKDEEEDDDKNSKFCDNTSQAAGWGVAKKCVKSDNYVINDKLAGKILRLQDFGKSDDKEVLQGQLRDLLEVLIELLTMQIANSNS